MNKDPKNINSAVYKKEGLSEHETEMNSIVVGNVRYIGRTCAYQDVDLYAARDIGKERDMEVGMLPPKLAQMMVNLSVEDRGQRTEDRKEGFKNLASHLSPLTSSGIYDPFCGLGTILIEAANMGYARLLASDLSPEMVRATEMNVREFISSVIPAQAGISSRRLGGSDDQIPDRVGDDGASNRPTTNNQQPTTFSVFRADASRLSDFANAEDLR